MNSDFVSTDGSEKSTSRSDRCACVEISTDIDVLTKTKIPALSGIKTPDIQILLLE